MDYTKITNNILILHLLKKRDDIEKEIQRLDSNILIKAELLKLSIEETDNTSLPIGGACDINNL